MQQGIFWGYLEKIVKYIFVSPDNKTTVMEMEHFFFFYYRNFSQLQWYMQGCIAQHCSKAPLV